MPNKNSTRFWLKPVNFALLLMFLGTTVFTFASIFYPENITNGLKGYILKWFLDIIKLLSGIVISSGFISLLLEISTIKNTVFDVFNRFLNADFDLSNYSIETLRNLHKKIIIQYNKGKLTLDMLNNSVYTLEEHVNSLLTGLSHDFHDVTCYVTPLENENIFIKKFKWRYNIRNDYKLKNKVYFEVSLPFEPSVVDANAKLEKLHITKFAINGTDLLNEVPKCKKVIDIVDHEHNVYAFKVIFERELQECQTHLIEMDYDIKIPMNDFRQVYRLKLPCKKLTHRIHLDGGDYSKWQLSVSGFAPFFHADSKIEDKFKVFESTKRSAEVLFDNWVLPGAGYVVTFRKNA